MKKQAAKKQAPNYRVGSLLGVLALLAAAPGCHGSPPQNTSAPQSRPPEQKRPAKATASAAGMPIPLIVEALTSVLLQRRPTVQQLAHCLGGTAVKDDLVNGYQIKSADARFAEATVRVSEVSAHPQREAIVDVTLLVKPGQALRLSVLSHVFGKPSAPHVITTLGPGPHSILLGHYDERITVGFGSGPHQKLNRYPVELALTARLMHELGPASPDPRVTEINIYRNDWSDIR